MSSYDNLGIKVIGISGFKQTGKSTLAKAIVDECHTRNLICERYAFAKPLKEICHILFGGTEDNWYGDFKTQKLEFWEDKLPITATPRRILQYIGTDLFRDCMGDDFWTIVAQKYIYDMYEASPFDVLVIDDVRFDNEATFLYRSYDSLIIELTRTATQANNDAHVSEKGLMYSLVEFRYNVDDRNVYPDLAAQLVDKVTIK